MDKRREQWVFRGVASAVAVFGLVLVLFASQARAAAATVSLSDPVPTLLNGSKVTADADRLAAGARPIQGVAADGVSRILIAVTAANAGQHFVFTIYNDQSAPSASTAEDGALAAVGSGDFEHGQLVTAAVTTSRGAMAFAIYRAPLDFARPGGADDSRTERSVTIHWTSGKARSGTIPIAILRPPVVLIHGLWSSPATWDDFTPFIGDPHFTIYRANYGSLVEPVSKSVPSAKASSIPASALGFSFNASYVAPQIDSFVNSFKAGHNPAKIAVAAVQADVVAHSMGGNVARTMPIMPGFASATTFKRGNVHKLITIDTPHLGSPLGIDLLPDSSGNDPNSCVRRLFNSGGLYVLASVESADGRSIDGAMGDLSGNGSGGALSPALEALLSSSTTPKLQTQPLPTAFIAAIAGPTQLGGLDYCHEHYRDKKQPPQCTKYALIQVFCSTAPLTMNMTSAGWENNVMMGPSDALVPFTSEYNNYSYAPTPLTAIHSASLKALGLVGPGVLQSEAGAPAQVIALLNTWIAHSPPFTGLR